MKRKLSLLLVLALVLSLWTNTTVSAGSALTARENAIVRAYVKTLETCNLKYLNQYKYPGLTYTPPTYTDVDLKLLNPKYSKSFVKSKNLYCLYVTGTIVVSTQDKLGLVKSRMGIYIKKKGSTSYAYTEKPVDGKDVYADKVIGVDDLSDSAVSALETYLTGKYGADTASALMYPDEDTDYSDDDAEYSGDDSEDSDDDAYIPGSGSQASSSSIDSAVKVGDSYSWSGSKDYLGDKVSASYSFTVKNSKDISADDIEKLGFKRPTDNKLAYKMLTVKVVVTDAKLTKGTGEGYMYESSLEPSIWGSMTGSGQYVIGGTTYGFDGSLSNAIRDKVEFTKLTPGKKASFTAEGKIILPVIKGETNYLVVKNEFVDYDLSKIFFKLN